MVLICKASRLSTNNKNIFGIWQQSQITLDTWTAWEKYASSLPFIKKVRCCSDGVYFSQLKKKILKSTFVALICTVYKFPSITKMLVNKAIMHLNSLCNTKYKDYIDTKIFHLHHIKVLGIVCVLLGKTFALQHKIFQYNSTVLSQNTHVDLEEITCFWAATKPLIKST